MSIRTLTIAAVLITGSSHAGTVLQTVDKDLTGGRADTTMTTYAQNGQLRVETSNRDGMMIFKDDALYAVNNKEKSYVTMDRASMKKMAETVNPMLKQMQERMAQMPPEQRAQMERMLGKSLPGAQKSVAREVRKTSRTGKAAGYSCNYVEMLADGVVEDELCVVAPSSLKGGDELMAAAQKMSAMLQDFMKDVDAPWLKDAVDKQTANYAKIGGIPVLSRHFADGKAVNETTLKSIRTESIPAASFAVPAGYTRREMMPGH
ncbi:hypothetical protein HNQ60_003385 [Povalibacter uvarum]|uniref:DUF4412 domain-containing protein n=1 Tax=Povalibacter uvarum TaxID=732238 RepID=A0A841HQX4_9GAMM|nr:DUF4412 domain-containing protein [Povalibacter uvarum]MBB6094498.1 hypothetical protein [Povalibacter uvarum]